MEPWKIAVIAALGVGIVGFGMFTNKGDTPTTPTPAAGVRPTPGPPAAYAKYMGGTLPSWSGIAQWANAPGAPSTASLNGKPVLVEVFRIECSHCQDAAPFLAQLHSRYAPRGVAFVGIQSPGDTKDPQNPESNWAGVQGWLKNQKYTWPVGFDAKSAWFQGKFGQNVTYPTLFLLDKSGKVSFIQSGHDEKKAIELAIELERIAPGSGDADAKASDLARFLVGDGKGDPNAASMKKSLETEIAGKLK